MALTKQQRRALAQCWPLHAAVLFPDLSKSFKPSKRPVEAAHLGGPHGFSPLHAAALTNDGPAVRWLASAGCRTDAVLTHSYRDLDPTDPTDDLCMLLVQQAEVDATFDFKACGALAEDATPLAVAAWCGHANAVAALLAAGAQPNERCWGTSPLGGQAICLVPALYRCIARPAAEGAARSAGLEAGRLEAAELLLEAGADCLLPLNRGRFAGCRLYPLRDALVLHSPAAAPMMRSLLRRLQPPAAGSGEGSPHLTAEQVQVAACAAVRAGEPAAALLFLAECEGAVPDDSKDGYMHTLLRDAAAAGLKEVVSAVVEALGPAMICRSLFGGSEQYGTEALENALASGQAGTAGLLLHAGVTLTPAVRKGALGQALRNGCVQGVRLALQLGAGATQQLLVAHSPAELGSAGGDWEGVDSPLVALLVAALRDFRSPDWFARIPLAEVQPRAVAIAEQLLSAGFRAGSATDVGMESTVLAPDNPLRLALQRPQWQPAIHARFPLRFRLAARALLLAARARRNSGGGGCSAAGGSRLAAGSAMGKRSAGGAISDVPGDLLLIIIGMAAYPLSAWLWSGD